MRMDDARPAWSFSAVRRRLLTGAGAAGLVAGAGAFGTAAPSGRTRQRADDAASQDRGTGATARDFADHASHHGQTLHPPPDGVLSVSASEPLTGLVLAPGSYPGQLAWVINAGNGSLTFGAAGQSNVADGTSDSIAALTARGFVWHAPTARWYRVS
jgi:hypothetical protein